MAYDIQLDSNGDIAIDKDITLIDGSQRVAQQIQITLRFWLGEWFLNTTLGVPYVERILIKNPNMNHVRQIIMEQVQSVPHVKSCTIDSVYMDNRQRNAEIIYTAILENGAQITKEVSMNVRS